MDAEIKTVSLNCRGWNNPIKAKRITSLTLKLRPSILLLQETHLKQTDGPILKSKCWSQQLLAPGSSKARGVAILIAKNCSFQVEALLVDPQGRFLFVKGLLADQKITVANVYVPNVGQLEFLLTILEKLEEFKEGDLILGGDFNLIVDISKDKSRLSP